MTYIDLIKSFNASLITSGLQYMKNAFKIRETQKSYGSIKDAFIHAGLSGVPITEMDITYWMTDWEIWNSCLDVVNNIAKNFPWKAERWDCDNRSSFVATLCELFLGINTCGQGFGEIVNKDTGQSIAMHWFNLIVDSGGNLYIYDVDNLGLRKQIVLGQPIIMGNWKYLLKSARFY